MVEPRPQAIALALAACEKPQKAQKSRKTSKNLIKPL
jgi:hypothetical protein